MGGPVGGECIGYLLGKQLEHAGGWPLTINVDTFNPGLIEVALQTLWEHRERWEHIVFISPFYAAVCLFNLPGVSTASFSMRSLDFMLDEDELDMISVDDPDIIQWPMEAYQRNVALFRNTPNLKSAYIGTAPRFEEDEPWPQWKSFECLYIQHAFVQDAAAILPHLFDTTKVFRAGASSHHAPHREHWRVPAQNAPEDQIVAQDPGSGAHDRCAARWLRRFERSFMQDAMDVDEKIKCEILENDEFVRASIAYVDVPVEAWYEDSLVVDRTGKALEILCWEGEIIMRHVYTSGETVIMLAFHTQLSKRRGFDSLLV
ncbi:hypothetical protein BDV98DRAFT_585061 [Pterulicium gracile]|uniref:Uncharacterized protein n=1 Tax=Pterulicium gracile TaxID=1884261 RepID=A0A5C3QCL4_9AGAR|nr:hypothetical protein BDV98DRAFT_585061 [Pterula gracilis]